MNVVIVILAILVALFALTFFTKRRFGVLGLALAAGAVLSDLWAADVTPYVQKAGFVISAPPMQTVVAAIIILLPAVLLLFSGPTYHKKIQRVVGAFAFALLAVAFLLEPLGNALVLTGEGKDIYTMLVDNREYIITAGIIFALFDLLSVKTPKAKDKE